MMNLAYSPKADRERRYQRRLNAQKRRKREYEAKLRKRKQERDCFFYEEDE